MFWAHILTYMHTCRVTQLCSILCNPLDYRTHGILQVRILEWVAISSSKALPDSRIKPTSPVSPALKVDSLLIELLGKPHILIYFKINMGFPGGSDGKEPACDTGDLGLIPASRIFGLVQSSCSSLVFYKFLKLESFYNNLSNPVRNLSHKCGKGHNETVCRPTYFMNPGNLGSNMDCLKEVRRRVLGLKAKSWVLRFRTFGKIEVLP